MRIYLEARLKGKEEILTQMQANSGADFVVLPREIIEKIKPKKMRSKVKVVGVGGKEIASPVYEIEIEVKDPKKNLKRSCKAKAIVYDIGIPLLSHEAMGKLGLILDPKTGSYELR